MKILLPILALVTAFTTAAAAELKVAILDLERAITNHHKLEAGLQRIRAQEVSFVKELEKLRLEGRRLETEAEDLRQLSLNNVFSADEREAKRRESEQRRLDFSAFRVRYEQTEAAGVSDLRQQAARLKQTVVEDVLQAARRVGERDGYNFIFNANRFTPAAGDVLFASRVDDVTDKVLLVMNAGRGSPPR